jgi:serralysin
MDNKIHVCIDKIRSQDLYKEKSDGPPGSIAVDSRFMWPSEGKTLKIKFLEGDPDVIRKVKEKFNLWLPHAKNIKYEYVTDGRSDVRITINQDDPTSWSGIGQEILDTPQDEATMHYGWFDRNTPDEEFERTAVHEMGHTLGFIHEMNLPALNIDWDEEKVYRWYEENQNWDRDTTYHNVFVRYSRQVTQYSEYDPISIMHYWIPAEFLKSGKEISGGNKLSQLDKEFARQLYGR